MSEVQGIERRLDADPVVSANEPRGIGGWLLLVALGQVVSLLRVLVANWQMYFDPDARKGFEEFPLASYGELAALLALTLLAIPTAILFFRKSRFFPRFFICALIAGLVVPALSVVWTAFTLSAQLGGSVGEFLVLDSDEIIQFVLAGIAALVWIPYTLKSRRVSNTFREQDGRQEPAAPGVASPVVRQAALLRAVVYTTVAGGVVNLLAGLARAIGLGVFSGQLLGGVLQIALAIWLFRGSDTARIILALLYFLGFVFTLALPMLAGQREPLSIAVAVALATLTGVCFWILAFSQRLRAELATNAAIYGKPDPNDA